MKKNLLICSLCVVSVGMVPGSAIAQKTGLTNLVPQHSSVPDGDSLLLEYTGKHVNSGTEGRKVLDAVYVRGLEKNVGNVNKMRTLLASKITDDEKIALTRILGSLYVFGRENESNHAILSDLRKLSVSGNQEIGRTAILTYSRLGYFADSVSLLTFARNSNYIDSTDYYGELAHLLPYAPADAQRTIVDNIKVGKNGFSAEILASLAQNSDLLKKLSFETKESVLSFLETNEPQFVQATGEYSLTDGIRYTAWLHALATLSSLTKNVNYNEVVMNQLNRERIDPRKIMGFLTSTEGQQLISNIGQTNAFDKVQQKINTYAAQHPMNTTMRDLVKDANEKIKTAKR